MFASTRRLAGLRVLALLAGGLCAAALPGCIGRHPRGGRPAAQARPHAPRQEPVTVAAVGDLILGSAVKRQIAAHGAGYPFLQIIAELRGADLTVGNLEGPLTSATVPTAGKRPQDIRARRQFIFRAPTACAEGLADAGFDVVSVANNHAMDYRAAGLEETLRALAACGVAAVGAGRDLATARAPAILRRKGSRVAFLAYSAVIPPLAGAGAKTPGVSGARAWRRVPFTRQVALDIAKAKRRADFVIVLVHWGIERRVAPTSEQRRLGRAMVDAGAAAVIGHHPHVLQGIERRDGGIIAYSLGNFVHVARASTMESALLRLRLSPGQPVAAEIIPVTIESGQPRPAAGKPAQRILDRLQRLSRGLGTPLVVRGGAAQVAGGA
jgi:poly-gamma-glutamate synthesis protein (capsule biosynthesis protein)